MKKNTQKKEKQEVKKENNLDSKKIDKEITENKSIYHNYLWYILIFSILGLLVEVLISFISTGTSQKFVLGPLCVLYGVGVAILIAFLNRYKGHKIKLFLLGAILGGLIQYIISFLLEGILGAHFWSCDWSKYNVTGRVSIEYCLLWGVLTVLIIEVIKKLIDKIINKINRKARKISDIIITIILVIEITFSMWAVIVYTTRAKETLNGKNYISNNNVIQKFENTAFSNEIMKSIFPNLQILDNEGNLIFIRDI